MSREEYVELIYGSNSAEMSEEVQRMRAEQMRKVRRRPSNTTIIHKVLWRALATTQRSTRERIRRAGSQFYLFLIPDLFMFLLMNSYFWHRAQHDTIRREFD